MCYNTEINVIYSCVWEPFNFIVVMDPCPQWTYLIQKVQAYKKELELILHSSKNTVPPSREYCENCDPRFKLLNTPKKAE